MSMKKIRNSVLSLLKDVRNIVDDDLELRCRRAEGDFLDLYKLTQTRRNELELEKLRNGKISQVSQDSLNRAAELERKLAQVQQKLDSTEIELKTATRPTLDLFHFTSTSSLPGILSDGINRGCVPVSPTQPHGRQPQAACLTSNGYRGNQTWVDDSEVDKIAVRFSLRVPESDLTSSQRLQDEFDIDREYVEALERNEWFFAFPELPPDKIVRTEFWTEDGYREADGEELLGIVTGIRLCCQVNELRDAFMASIPSAIEIH